MQPEHIDITDHRVPTPLGGLFARIWRPARLVGSCAPVILVHDSLGCVELWRDLPRQLALASGRAIVAYDRLGFGRSDPHSGRLTADFVANEAHAALPAVLDGLGIREACLLGHSVGGAMAAVSASLLGQRCTGLVTESAQTFAEDVTLVGIRAARTAFAKPGQLERLARYHGAKAQWVLDAWIETWLSDAFAAWDIAEDLKKITCPVLSIHGDNDEFGSTVHPARIAQLSAGSTSTCILEGCGHVPHREKPEIVVQAITDFLSRID